MSARGHCNKLAYCVTLFTIDVLRHLDIVITFNKNMRKIK